MEILTSLFWETQPQPHLDKYLNTIILLLLIFRIYYIPELNYHYYPFVLNLVFNNNKRSALCESNWKTPDMSKPAYIQTLPASWVIVYN